MPFRIPMDGKVLVDDSVFDLAKIWLEGEGIPQPEDEIVMGLAADIQEAVEAWLGMYTTEINALKEGDDD
jgi:hypothetical protein